MAPAALPRDAVEAVAPLSTTTAHVHSAAMEGGPFAQVLMDAQSAIHRMVSTATVWQLVRPWKLLVALAHVLPFLLAQRAPGCFKYSVLLRRCGCAGSDPERRARLP